MIEETYMTEKGNIHYFISDVMDTSRATLVFLPGLTADHRLFDDQVGYFGSRCNVLVWDAPGTAASRPFELTFSLMDEAIWLHEILESEHVSWPVLVGQSMGGYLSQCYMQNYPGEVRGFVSIDSAPMKKRYFTAVEIWLLKRTDPIYRGYPWKALKRTGSNGCAETERGRRLMYDFMDTYSKKEYCDIACHGYRIIAEAVAADLPYIIDCPAVLICGEKDKAGSVKRYNRNWTRDEGLKLFYIKGAGHNSNVDDPETVNGIIEEFVSGLE